VLCVDLAFEPFFQLLVSIAAPHIERMEETYLERGTLAVLGGIEDHTSILDILHIRPALD
jgi:hypothetical protein